MMFFPRNPSPEFWAIWGVVAILLSGFIGFISAKELLALPSEPQHMLISEALSKVSEKRLWVVLDDIQWDCSHVYHLERSKSDDTYIAFTDKDKMVLGLALFGGEKDCKSVTQNKVAGVLDVGVKGTDGATLYKALTEDGVDVALYENNGRLLSFCTFCGRQNSLIGVVLSIIFLASGIFLFNPLIKSRKARKSANHFMKRNILRL
jgi:hypothetical protein